MKFSVTILGSGAAIPTSDRNPTAHVVSIKNRILLIDCGEGTQMQLRKAGFRIQKISHIFISHLHGDHYYGLIGLINTMHLYGRNQPLHLFGIPQLKQLIDLQLELSGTTLVYPLIFHPLDAGQSSIICDDEMMQVTTIPLNHRIPTCGFLVREKMQLRKIRKEFVKSARIPVPYYEKIRKGEDFIDEQGKVFRNEDITEDPVSPKSYAYCSDTAYHESVIPIVKDVDLLYHEATFMEDKADDAHAKFHSTAREAALIARSANVKKLVIGHFSARYNETDGLLKEAQEIFPETVLAVDGLTIEV